MKLNWEKIEGDNENWKTSHNNNVYLIAMFSTLNLTAKPFKIYKYPPEEIEKGDIKWGGRHGLKQPNWFANFSSADEAKKFVEERLSEIKRIVNYKYVWLDINTGKFSNSWDESTHKGLFSGDSEKELIKHAKEKNWKLIKYECLTDDNFEFYNQMKLR